MNFSLNNLDSSNILNMSINTINDVDPNKSIIKGEDYLNL